ncbi:type II toxin-antitoxin system ParD family antitoxin [Bradyrhizobium sp. STM 3557]|uniref:ribbon-helix-helix domain-containing protein n=1 Tax=Bradyrhizobium sp. STM 3557 TaxID=578920 RepID=UPI00388E6CFB
MATRHVVLTDHQEKVIQALVDSGRYQDATEVLGEGLRLVEQHAAEEATKLEGLREAAQVGFGALDRGAFKEFDSIEQLQDYLNGVSEKIISRLAK